MPVVQTWTMAALEWNRLPGIAASWERFCAGTAHSEWSEMASVEMHEAGSPSSALLDLHLSFLEVLNAVHR